MIDNYEAKLTDIYTKIREDESRKLKNRKAEIEKLYPEIIKIDNDIKKLSISMSMAILNSDNGEQVLEEYKEKITNLRAKKYEMLVSKGYDQEYLNLHYICPLCKDTGYIGTKKCSCYRNKLIKLHYKNSLLEDILKTKNFDNFKIELFSSTKNNNEKYSPRDNMINILEGLKAEYIPSFNSHDKNLLFYGNPGSGKSFLSYCIAKELLDLGYLVVYKTSEELIADLRDIRFNNNSNLKDLLINCDLLIIDDLGAEQKSDFTITEFFNLLNKKLLLKKKMLISTNLSLQGITEFYSERICSRLIGDFKLYKFFSDDIRIKLNLQNIKGSATKHQ